MKKGASKLLQFYWFRAFLNITLVILGVNTCKKTHFKGNVPYFMKMNTYNHLNEKGYVKNAAMSLV